MKPKSLVGSLALAALVAWNAAPAEQPMTPPKPDALTEVASHIPGARPDQLRLSPIQGIYEFTRGAEIAYVTSDGKYAIAGDLYDLTANDDLTETHRREVRQHLIAAVPETDMVIFGPKDPKYTVTVFTDVDCGYCRKLHSEIAEYNRLGVRVRYLMYPRTGPDTSSWTKAEQVVCSPDRNDALTRARLRARRNTRHRHGERRAAARLCPAGRAGEAPQGRYRQVAASARRGPGAKRSLRARDFSARGDSACPACLPTPWHRAARPSSR
ncbi:MAG: DsbC family protein [Gammaproteobacteria bacterium]|nr:MAG: DsbC family protein [Gammaproteobacteria bacterium]